MQYYK